VFPSIVGNPRVALLQPPEEPVQPAGPPALPAARKKKIIIDLTESERIKRKKESKTRSNKIQGEKRRREREAERERNKSLSPGEKIKLAKGVVEAEKGWELLHAYDKDSDYFNDYNWSGGKKKKKEEEGGEEVKDNDDWWELNKLPQVIEEINKAKKEERERAELARIERGKSRWAIKAAELEKKEKEIEKENKKEKDKDKENKEETDAERKFRLASERSLGRKEWRERINRLMTGKPEPKVRFDATDSPLSSNMEEGELDYLSQPGQPGDSEESEQDNNNNI
jgi:hypothetical protein